MNDINIAANGAAPPSTLAAQIVDSLQHPNDLQADDAVLRELLDDILRAGSAAFLDATVETNFQLVDLLLKACRQALGIKLPSDSRQRATERVVKAFKVIQLAITHSPRILLFCQHPGSAKGENLTPNPPSFVWIIPRLIPCLFRKDGCSDGAKEALETCLQVERRLSSSSCALLPISTYLKGCARDLLSQSILFNASKNSNPARSVIVPTLDTLLEACPSSSHSTIVGDAFQANSSQIATAASMILLLLSRMDNSRTDATRTWLFVLDQATRLVNELTAHLTLKSGAQDLSDPLTTLLRVLRNSLMSSSKLGVSRHSLTCNVKILCTLIRSVICSDTIVPDSSTQEELCWAMHDCLATAISAEGCRELLSNVFQVYVRPLIDQPRDWNRYGNDFKVTLLASCSCILRIGRSHDTELLQQLQNKSLQSAMEKLSPTSECSSVSHDADTEPPAKRVRTSLLPLSSERLSPIIQLSQTLKSLGIQLDKEGMLKVTPNFWKFIPPAQDDIHVTIVNLMNEVVKLCPILSWTSQPKPQLEQGAIPDPSPQSTLDEVFCLLTGLVTIHPGQSSSLISASAPRARLMGCLEELLRRSTDPSHFDLTSSVAGKWCLHSLSSRSKDLRISAGKTVRCYIQYCSSYEAKRQNKLTALDATRRLAREGLGVQHEMAIWVLGQIADANPGEDEMLIILFRLIEYLGHPHPMVNSLAYAELLRISGNSSYRAQKLIEPYWKFIAISLVKDMLKKPSAIQRLCDLIDLPVEKFLLMTKQHTVPYLVLTKRIDVLERIAASVIADKSVANNSNRVESAIVEVCLNAEQLPSLLALLLTHAPSDPQAFVVSVMTAISEEFCKLNVADLIKSDLVKVVFEVLRGTGDGEEKHFDNAQAVIAFIADQNQNKVGSSSRRSSRKLDSIGAFFETYSLAVLKLLSDIVTEVHCSQILPERKRCLIGIKHLILIGAKHAAGATPQLSACLRSAIAIPDLCDEGLLAWISLLQSIPEISSLIEPTFALIQATWEQLCPSTQQKTHETLLWLFKERQELMREKLPYLPALSNIPLLSKFEKDIAKHKNGLGTRKSFVIFAERLLSEDPIVITRTLEELEIYLASNQEFLQSASLAGRSDPVVAQIVQALLDVSVRMSSGYKNIASGCAKCLGLIGCLDPFRVEFSRSTPEKLVLSNFAQREETVDFVTFFLEEVLVKSFLASINPRSQNFLGFAMQNLLEICGFTASGAAKGLESTDSSEKWFSISEGARTVLTPFLNSRYTLMEGNSPAPPTYPIHSVGKRHAEWLRELVYDLLRTTQGENAKLIFDICKRIIRGQDITISRFLLPYVALNVLIGGDLSRQHDIGQEFLSVLIQPMDDLNQASKDELILCSQDIFRTLDYFSRWVHQKKMANNRVRQSPKELEDAKIAVQIIETLTGSIPAVHMSRRAVECRNFSRGLFYWEQYIRQYRVTNEVDLNENPQAGDFLYEKLQEIYVQIDEPDGIEGASSYLQLLDAEQQVLEHRKAGRWTAVQDWNQLLLSSDNENVNYHAELLTSLRESGQYEAILNLVSAYPVTESISKLREPYVVESCWNTSKWDKLADYLPGVQESGAPFQSIGAALVALYRKDIPRFQELIDTLRIEIARSLSKASTSNLQACRDAMLYLHAISEIDMIRDATIVSKASHRDLFEKLERRLNAVGAYPSDKQYLLGLQRAAIQVSHLEFSDVDLSTLWLTSAQLYRKQDCVPQAFNAILHASQLKDNTAAIEHSRLLWKEGHHRKAIHSLEGAIAAKAFERGEALSSPNGEPSTTKTDEGQRPQNILAAKAALLRAKWVDRAGQTQSDSIIKLYQEACSLYTRWEKGQYSLGRHYNKILETEKLKAPAKQSQSCISGELAKHVIENYLRSLAYGAKYVYQTLPRVLTLWCEMGSVVEEQLDSKFGTDKDFRAFINKQRRSFFDGTCAQLRKYIDRLPAFVFYTALNQICARICHKHNKVAGGLTDIVVKVCVAYPQQALWTLFAMIRSTTSERKQRGESCIAKIQEQSKRHKNESSSAEIKTLIAQGMKITEQLLEVCNADLRKFPKRQSKVSIKDLGFSHKQAGSSRLALPIESTLTASIPTAADTVDMRRHKAFTKDTITIQAFQDEALLLSSLIRPRKVDIVGSDGKVYGILCKPKDDLRLDQRLLEFNATIKRLLKKDAESTKRRLYVQTYSVIPLNEQCGLIEWVEGLKTHRDVLLGVYLRKGITPDYRVIGNLIDEAAEDLSKFEDQVMGMFPPVLHEWFTETFPDPEAWYTARLRYTRSCAVMSMVGHVLGLGDRHSENVLVEEGNGGIMHVDFNCLFDKGLTFEKPEKVPFRLTSNMVDAFGVYGYEGPYRKASELTMAILRQHEDTLMTVLEQFLYDPTIELMGGRKRRNNVDVPNTPEGVLESVRNKLRGLLPKEAIPLSVPGHVEYLIQQARDPVRLASMYIGWCAFL